MASEMSLPMVTAAESLRSHLHSDIGEPAEVASICGATIAVSTTEAPAIVSVMPWKPLDVANLDGGHTLSCCEVVESETTSVAEDSADFCPGPGELSMLPRPIGNS